MEHQLHAAFNRLQCVKQERAEKATVNQRSQAALRLQLNGLLKISKEDIVALEGILDGLMEQMAKKSQLVLEWEKRVELHDKATHARKIDADLIHKKSIATEQDLNRVKMALQSKEEQIINLQKSNEALQQELEITRFDHEENKCMLCSTEFGLTLWPHHCRKCHRKCCYACAPVKVQEHLEEFGENPTRVCNNCVDTAVAQVMGIM